MVMTGVYAQDDIQDLSMEEQEQLAYMMSDSISGKIGKISLPSANCTVNVPDGFVYLDPAQSRHLLMDYWNNPENSVTDILGIMVKNSAKTFYDIETAYVISYENAGYVSDEDADEMNYDELLKEIQDGLKEENEQNPDAPQWELVGWAWQPAYNRDKKVISWAKHYRINGDHEVINYDVRVLGKAGFVVITAIGDPSAKDQMLADNSAIIGSVNYIDGYKYSDFNPDTDHIAEWTIGGLIAGKVLTKVGLWAFLAKFSKIIIIAIIAAIGVFRKKIATFFGRRKDKSETDEKENPQPAE